MKIHYMKSFCVFLFIACSGVGLQGQPVDLKLPIAFPLGTNEGAYEAAKEAYNPSLISVHDNDMAVAMEKWVDLLQDISAYADKIDYNINGLKVWLHVFWEPDGRITHIGYFRQPNSRNIPEEELTAFFKGFVHNYDPVMDAGKRFSHYAGATFPVFAHRRQ